MKTKHFVLMASFMIMLYGCYEEPVANFNYSLSDTYVPVTVTFTNMSVNADSYQWDLGDGNTSTATDPVHVYADGGTYNVTLMASGKGGDHSTSQSFTLSYPPPVADFSYSYTSNVAPAFVTFTNLSQDAEQYQWDFGDGNTSTATSPTHTYNEGGYYSVVLVASGTGGESYKTKSITIIQPTSYIFKNGSSVTLKEVYTFYLQGDTPVDEVSHGTLYSGDQTDEVITEYLVIDVIFEFYFDGVNYIGYLGDPYNYDLTPNYQNLLVFDDYTTFYWAEQSTSVKSTRELKAFRQQAKPVMLKDLLKK